MHYKVKEVAKLAGVSVRTLHHYDQIGLLKPQSTSPAKYRLYTGSDLERLQQVLFFRELGFDLQEIRRILDHPGFDKIQAMKNHREILLLKKRRLDEMLQTVEKTIDSMEGGVNMSKEELYKGFDMSEIEKHREKYARETEEKYGGTEAYRESQTKTAKYTKEDWARISAANEALYQTVIDNMEKGPADPEVQKAVHGLRQHITDNFYNCTPEIFRGLGDLYVEDGRFTANIDKYKPGLAQFLRAAMHIYCDKLQGK